MPQDAATGRIQLKPAQQRVVAVLTANADSDLTRGQYEELTGVSRSQAAYDLAELVEAGILRRIGAGRATRYQLAHEGGNGGGGQRHWTNDRIRAELEGFCSERQAWPSAAEFKAAGRGDLYVAASRYGSIGHWAEALGYPRPARGATVEPQPLSLRRRLIWAAAGALAAIGLVAGGGAVVLALSGDPNATSPRAVSPAAPTRAVIDESMHPAHAAPTRATKAKPAVRRSRAHSAKRPAPASRTRAPSTGALITSAPPTQSTYAPRSTHSPQGATATSRPSSGTGGPVPLAAPPSGRAPQPIPPPQK